MAERCEVISHDDAVRRLIAAVARIEPAAVGAAFAVGVGGSAVRGLQPLCSYAFARHLSAHPFAGSDPARAPKDSDICDVCGLYRRGELRVDDELARVRDGAVWNELPLRFVADLEDFAALPRVEPTAADRARLQALLELCARVEPGCTPTQLAQHVARAGVLPRARSAQLRGILSALADAGVLPNARCAPPWDAFLTNDEFCAVSRGPGEITGPLKAWRGASGVNWARAAELFPGVTAPGAAAPPRLRTARASRRKATPTR